MLLWNQEGGTPSLEALDPRVKTVYQQEARLRMCRELHMKFQPLIYQLPKLTEDAFMQVWKEALAQERRDLGRALERSVPMFKEHLASHV